MTRSTPLKLVLAAALLVFALEAQAAQQWHFIVSNQASARIVKLQVSENRKTWGDFDIGKGIGIGESATLVWDESTNDERCDQWIRAQFMDGSYSAPSLQDFCNNLDDPIEFAD